MTELKNPDDSLCNYFDELLSDDDYFTSSSESFSIPPIGPSTPTTTVPSSPLSIPLVRKAEAKIAVTSAFFADPIAEQKQKLQKLLQSAQPKIEMVPEVRVEVSPALDVKVNSFQVDLTEIQDWNIEPVIATTIVPVTAPALVPTAAPVVCDLVTPSENSVEMQVVDHGYHMPGLEWLPNGLPPWAQTRFDVLLFTVSGLILAVPLISLGKILPITDELTPLFGQADWFMGLQPTSTGKIRTVNTARFVMPERYDENFAKNAKYVVSINGVPWGLAVDSVKQPIRLSPDDVKWRSNRSKRPWLAGTIKEHMCALLDIPMIGQLLMDADKNVNKKQAR